MAIFGESWTMIATTVVDEIRRLLRQGRLSQRKIASRIGVSRGTVNAIALGKFVGADYLLHVLAEKTTATIRLVEVASGQVKLEGQVALRNDLSLSAAAIREKILTALRPESQAGGTARRST
jgi:transcriptional regulator with XRE-family HTH domain